MTEYTNGRCKSAPNPVENTTGNNANMVVMEVIKMGFNLI